MSSIEIFPMIPAESRTLWPLIGGLLVVFVLISALFLYLGYASRHVRFEVSTEGLHVRGDLFGRLVPAALIDTDGALPLDLDRAPAFRPKRRSLGSALPGYRAGWFTLQSGERALLFVTDPSSVAYIPTRDGYSVIVSVEDPRALISALMKVSPPAHGTFNPPRPGLDP